MRSPWQNNNNNDDDDDDDDNDNEQNRAETREVVAFEIFASEFRKSTRNKERQKQMKLWTVKE